MKKLVVVLVMVVLSLSGCAYYGDAVTGNGKKVTQEYDFNDFVQISSNNDFEVTYEQSDSYALEITCDENIVEYLRVTKSGDKLSIGLQNSNNYRNLKLFATVKAPTLTHVTANGSSDFRIVDGLNSKQDVSIDLNGASSLKGDIIANNVDIKLNGGSTLNGSVNSNKLTSNINGSSKISLDGNSKQLNLTLEGASTAKMYDFNVNDATINMGGSSKAEVTINNSLDLTATGASKLNYKGEAKIDDISLSGSSKIYKK